MATVENSFLKISEDYFECAICYEHWIYRNPRVFPCQHTYCGECILDLWKSYNNDFSCPLCKRKIIWPTEGVNGFPRNLVASNIYTPEREDKKLTCKKHEKEIIFICKECSDHKICKDCYREHQNHNLVTLESYIRDGKIYHGCHKINNALKSLHQYQLKVLTKDKALLKEIPSIMSCIIEEKQTANIKKLEMIRKCISRINSFIQFKEEFNEDELNETIKTIENIDENLPEISNLDFKNNEYEGKLFMNLKDMLLSNELNDPKNVNLNYEELTQHFDKILNDNILEKISKNLSSIDYIQFSSENSISIQNVLEIHSATSCYDGSLYIGIYGQRTGRWSFFGYPEKENTYGIWQLNSKTLKPETKYFFKNKPLSIIDKEFTLYVCFKNSIKILHNSSLKPIYTRKDLFYSFKSLIAGYNDSLIVSTNNSIEYFRVDNHQTVKYPSNLINSKILINSISNNNHICNWKKNSLAILNNNNLFIYEYSENIKKEKEQKIRQYDLKKYLNYKINRNISFSSITSIENEFLIISEYYSQTLFIFHNLENEPQIYKINIKPYKIWNISIRKELWISNGKSKLLGLSYNI